MDASAAVRNSILSSRPAGAGAPVRQDEHGQRDEAFQHVSEQAAASVEEAVASMEQMTATVKVKGNADTARQAGQLSDSASAAATKGGHDVADVVKRACRGPQSTSMLSM
jgi:methyl-accepting chemotaxis protein